MDKDIYVFVYEVKKDDKGKIISDTCVNYNLSLYKDFNDSDRKNLLWLMKQKQSVVYLPKTEKIGYEVMFTDEEGNPLFGEEEV